MARTAASAGVVRAQGISGIQHRLPPVLRVLLAVPRRGTHHRQRHARAAHHTLIAVHQQGLDRRGAEIEAEEHRSGRQRMPVEMR